MSRSYRYLMFAPELGVAEDAATASASGPLGSYLVRHKIVPAETAANGILSLQGVKKARGHLERARGRHGRAGR